MQLRSDLSQRAVVTPADYEWVDSPMPGVQRMMLDRDGGEVARATSLVRYAPNSTFLAHIHGGGEEFLVLDGEFGDEHGRYGPGVYARNPIGTSHSPVVGAAGALILVKLHQFSTTDTAHFTLDTRAAQFQPGAVPGVEALQLHQHGSELVRLVRFAPNLEFPGHDHPGGEELFVIQGSLHDEYGDYPQGSWVRSPVGSSHDASSGPQGCLLWIKTGHLG